MRLLRRIKDATLSKRVGRDVSRRAQVVTNITLKARIATLRWYGHMLIMDEGNTTRM